MSSKKKYKRKLKTPIAYYGGKQNMLRHIIPLIPNHHTYVEPFFGGGAVFFAKTVSSMEIINDINDHVINFYKVLKNNYKALIKQIDSTLHSRSTQKLASSILFNPKMKDRVKKAWAFWVMCTMSFGNDPRKNAGFAFDTLGSTTKKVKNAKENLITNFADRLENVQIECTDAIRVIKSRDSENTFFYIDPPYVSSNCGSYTGYTMEDFELLLKTLSNLKGKFLLSSYPEDILMKYRKKHKWFHKDISKPVRVYGKRKKSKTKIECLTSNYPLTNTNLQNLQGMKNTSITIRKNSLEHKFINRYCNLHRKLKTKNHIRLFIRAIQKAISEKKILKSSIHTDLIQKIQDDLINIYNKFNSKREYIQVQLSAKKLSSCLNILGRHHELLSVKYINSVAHLLNREVHTSKAKSLHNRIAKAINNKSLNENDAHWELIGRILHHLKSFVKNHSLKGKLTIPKEDQRQIEKIISCDQNLLQGVSSSPRNTIMNSTEVVKLDFEKLGFKDKWLKLIGDPSGGFTAMIFGKPKMGKSYLAVDFAGYLARNHGTVLYVAREEGIDDTLQLKLKDKKVAHPDLYVSDFLPGDLSHYDFVFLDSVNKLRLSPLNLEDLKKKYPETSFIYIFQTTKLGNFRGANEFQHDVDIVIEVPEKGRAVQFGRFNQGGEIGIFDQ